MHKAEMWRLSSFETEFASGMVKSEIQKIIVPNNILMRMRSTGSED